MKYLTCVFFALIIFLISLPTAFSDDYTAVFSEGFEGDFFGTGGWTTVDLDGGGIVWHRSDYYRRAITGGVGYSVGANSDAEWSAYNSSLVSPSIDLASASEARLSFLSEFQVWSGGDQGVLEVSTDGGANWSTLLTLTEDEGVRGDFDTTHTIDLSAYTGNSISLRWIYTTVGNWEWWWYIDEVLLEAIFGQIRPNEPEKGFAELNTSAPMVAFKVVDSFQNMASGRMLHLRQSGHGAFALSNPLDGLMLASAGDIQNIGPISAEGEKSKHFWGKLYGVTGDVDGDHRVAGYDYEVGGFTIGADFKAFKNIFLGALVGISTGDADTYISDKFEVTSYQVGLYGSYENGPYHLDGVLSYAGSDYETSRSTPLGTASSDYDGEEWGSYVEFGYVTSKDNIILEPYLATQYIVIDQDAFSETGAGIMNMAVDRRDDYSLKVIAGGRINFVYEHCSGAVFVPGVHFAYRNEINDSIDLVTANFVTAPAANSFVIEGFKIDRQSFELGVGCKMLLANNLDFDIGFSTEFNADYQAYDASVDVKYSW